MYRRYTNAWWPPHIYYVGIYYIYSAVSYTISTHNAQICDCTLLLLYYYYYNICSIYIPAYVVDRYRTNIQGTCGFSYKTFCQQNCIDVLCDIIILYTAGFVSYTFCVVWWLGGGIICTAIKKYQKRVVHIMDKTPSVYI